MTDMSNTQTGQAEESGSPADSPQVARLDDDVSDDQDVDPPTLRPPIGSSDSVPVSPTRNVLVITPTGPMVTATTSETSSPVRIPGTFPPEWLPDHETDTCMACECLFTLIKRRHHCRSCGKIFCGDCCKEKAKLLYMDNREARVCNDCHNLIEYTLTISSTRSITNHYDETENQQQRRVQRLSTFASSDIQASSSSTSSSVTAATASSSTRPSSATTVKAVHGVLKTSNQAARLSGALDELCNISNSSSSDQHSNKQVTFSDGIRPGTDLSEAQPPCPTSPSSSNDSPLQTTVPTNGTTAVANSTASASNTTQAVPTAGNQKRTRSGHRSSRNITVCDELGYLPPIVISKDSPIANSSQLDDGSAPSNSLASLIINQFKVSKKSIQASMESRSCPLNGVVKFEEIADLVGVNNVITFLLLKSFYLKVKIIRKVCCIDKNRLQGNSAKNNLEQQTDLSLSDEFDAEAKRERDCCEGFPEYWCFTSSGLDKLGQNEIVFVLDKDKGNSCIPRDIFKIYLTLHELALRRQAIENLGNLLFQDGLFGSRDTAGLLFVQPTQDHCLQNLVLPEKGFLVALVLQRWEVPWSKVFPMRLLMRLGHKYNVYPYPIVSHRTRGPVYYEIGHTIISILGDFRNFRYSLTHVEGLKVMLDKTSKKVTIQLNQSNYMQFSKVLDCSNNEHVLAWSAGPFPETDGHLVSVQNDEGNYETVEFYRKSSDENISFKNLETGPVLGASFIVFSGALKLTQSGQPAKISIVEDGLLIQIQSCTMSALRNAIHYMDNFDIECESSQDPLNRVEIRWQAKDDQTP